MMRKVKMDFSFGENLWARFYLVVLASRPVENISAKYMWFVRAI